MFGLVAFSGLYAKDYTMYSKPDDSSSVLATVNDHDPKFMAIFAKNNGWVEVVNKVSGQTGWVKQNSQTQTTSKQQDYDVAAMVKQFEERQKLMQEKFNRDMESISQLFNQKNSSANVAANSSNNPNQSKNVNESSYISVVSDGKTAKIIKKTDDNGKVQVVKKEVPLSELHKALV